MARLIWIGVGAVGGVYAYRKGEQVREVVREQGVAGTAQIVATAALQAGIGAVRAGQVGTVDPAIGRPQQPGLQVGSFRITRAGRAPAPRIVEAAIMDTGVIDITDAGRPKPDAARRRKAR